MHLLSRSSEMQLHCTLQFLPTHKFGLCKLLGSTAFFCITTSRMAPHYALKHTVLSKKVTQVLFMCKLFENKSYLDGCISAWLLVILNLLPLCCFNALLIALLASPPSCVVHDRGRYPAASCGTQPVSLLAAQLSSHTAFIPPPCWDSLAHCRGQSWASSPSAGWEGAEVLPCQPGSEWGENSWECGCCTPRLCSHGTSSSSVSAEAIQHLSHEAKQLCSVILTTEGAQVQFKQQKIVPEADILCGVCLQQLPWVKYIDYKNTSLIAKLRRAFHRWGSAAVTTY